MLLWLLNLGFAAGPTEATQEAPARRSDYTIFEYRCDVTKEENRVDYTPARSKTDSVK